MGLNSMMVSMGICGGISRGVGNSVGNSLSNGLSNEWIRKGLPLFGLTAVLLTSLQATQASAGETFFETIGFSIAVGTVLGASTLPFYDQPSQNLVNLAIGAGAGALLGIGTQVIGESSSSGSEGYLGVNTSQKHPVFISLEERRGGALRGGLRTQPVRIWAPVVSLTW